MAMIIDKEKCCGCGSCGAVCPQGCITMQPDEEGFLYPQMDTQRCTSCQACRTVCPVLHMPRRLPVQGTYSAYSRDEAVRRESSSGGVFTELARRVLENGGAVFGAAFDGAFCVEHICVERQQALYKLRSSKYVQSRTGGTYGQARALLEQGRLVLYSGTPCQIAGLRAYLKKDYENLITQSMICHGVPFPKIWKKYLNFIAGKDTVQSVQFRNKETGWKKYQLKIMKKDGTYGATVWEDPYMKAFVRNLALRPSCGTCAFKGYEQVADITLADYWGVEQLAPELDDDKGLSLVFIHSKKGQRLFESIHDAIVWRPADMDKAVLYNQSLVKASAPHGKRAFFFSNLEKYPFDMLVERCLKSPATTRLAKKAAYSVSRVKNRVKRMLNREHKRR